MKRFGIFILVVTAFLFCGLPIFGQAKKLTARQMKTLNRKLPAKVRNFLQTADVFEIWTDTISEEPEEKPVYQPNKKYVIKRAATRSRVLNAFYRDIATGGNGAACFYPNHSIVARKGKRHVRLTICYTCGEFVVSGSFGEWDAGLNTDDPIFSEEIIKRLLEKYGEPVTTAKVKKR
jgi:hypothetical protein